MSNVALRKVLATLGGGQLSLQLNGPQAYAVAGGSNLASLTNTGGHLSLQAASGCVGVNTLAPTCALDVSGAVRASSFVDASGNRIVTTVAAPWTSGATAFRRDDGVPLSVGAGGALSCRYSWSGSVVTAELRMVLGAAPSLGTVVNGWTWTLPVAASAGASDGAIGTALLRNASAWSAYSGVACCMPDGLSAKVLLDSSTTMGVHMNIPFAWSAGDSVSLSLCYEAAAVQLPPGTAPVAFAQNAASASLGLGLSPAAGATSNTLVVAGALGVGGVSLPSAALDVSGDVNFTGILRQSGAPYVGSQWTTTTSNIFVASDVAVGGQLTGASLAGACVSDSLTSSSSASAASSAALSNVNAAAFPR